MIVKIPVMTVIYPEVPHRCLPELLVCQGAPVPDLMHVSTKGLHVPKATPRFMQLA